MKTFDGILKDIGEFGPYQKRLYFLICLPGFPLAGLLIAIVFILGVPEHRCKIPGYENDTYEVHSDIHASVINTTIPADSSGDHDYDRCHYFRNGTSTLESCTEWVYDTSVYKNTFAQQLDMVCDSAIRIPNAQMIYFFGVLAGSLVYGQLSDIIGRQKTMYLCILVLLGSSVGLVFMVEYIGFCVIMFVLGGAILGLYMTSYVIGVELVGPSKRKWTGNVNQFVLIAGALYLVLMVYLLRQWKYFTLAVALPCCLFLPYYWIIPESCRWLLSKGKVEEAKTILQNVAKRNKKTFNEKDLEVIPEMSKEGRVWLLFSTKRLAFRTTVIFINWFVCSMSYYGVVLNTSNLGGSIFLNFTLITAVEAPADIMVILLVDRLGRKRLYLFLMILGSLACIGTLGPILDGSEKFHPLLITLALVGKFCINGAFQVLYMFSAELFPTVVRNGGMGLSSSAARVGSMVAPYIAKSADLVGGTVGKTIPLTLFGIAMFITGLSTLVLPETLNKPMPETIEDSDNIK